MNIGKNPSIGLLGCGQWGRNHARVLAELGALRVICDTSAERAGKLASDLGVEFSDDLDSVLARSDIEGVVIATPAVTHGEISRRAINVGKHVYVEKPMALATSDAKAVATLAVDKGLTLMAGHLLLYHPAFCKLLDLTAEGNLGQIKYIVSNRLNQGLIRTEENALWSLAPHDFSMILALARRKARSISAIGQACVQPAVIDLAQIDIDFGDGLKAHVYCSWLHPYKEHRLCVIGTQAMAVFDDSASWEEKLSIYRHKVDWGETGPQFVKAQREVLSIEKREPLREAMLHFFDCIMHNRAPLTGPDEAIPVLQLLTGAQQSLDEGKPIMVEGSTAPTGSNLDSFFHKTAVIDAGSIIGKGTKIWHFSHVLGNCRIGGHCVIGQNVTIGPDVVIGNGCKIQNNVSVYKGVTLEDNVFCGPSMVFTNVLTPRAHVERKSEFAPTLVKRGATIGANATIICGVTIGAFAMVGAGSVVTKNVPDYALVVGNPARRIGWVSNTGERLGKDLICPRTGQRYVESNETLRPAF